MTNPEIIVRALRSTQSRSKRKLLDAAATTIEYLTTQLEMARAERDAVTRRMIELEQLRGGAQSSESDLQSPRRTLGTP